MHSLAMRSVLSDRHATATVGWGCGRDLLSLRTQPLGRVCLVGAVPAFAVALGLGLDWDDALSETFDERLRPFWVCLPELLEVLLAGRRELALSDRSSDRLITV